ncbi:enoyl-CoA hydratase [Roseobacteraceae bacterium NS-SX3]
MMHYFTRSARTAQHFSQLGKTAGAACLLLLTACQLPRDPEGTTRTVSGATLRVGALIVPLTEPDSRAIDATAQALSAQVEIVEGDPHQLFAMLEEGEIHMVAGRLPASSPFKTRVGLSNPIGGLQLKGETVDRVLAVRKGENRFLMTVNQAIGSLKDA